MRNSWEGARESKLSPTKVTTYTKENRYQNTARQSRNQTNFTAETRRDAEKSKINGKPSTTEVTEEKPRVRRRFVV